MSVTAKTLIQSKFAANTATTEYTTPVGNRTIIDKMTATNISGGALTVSIYLVPSGSTADSSNQIVQSRSISAGSTFDVTEVKNHVLDAGGFISVSASAATSIVIRASGREVT